MTDRELQALLEELVFPVAGEPFEFLNVSNRCQLQLVGVEDVGGDRPMHVTTRLIVWDRKSVDDDWMVSNIKEQYCGMLWRVHMEEPEARIRAYLEGLKQALEVVLGSHKTFYLMPQDLIAFGKHPLNLTRAQTADDFTNALLKKSRLGKLIPDR